MEKNLEKYTMLKNELETIFDDIYKKLENSEKITEYITIGVNGKNVDIPLCADSYENFESFINTMIKVEEE